MNNALVLSSILLWIVVLFNLLLTIALVRRISTIQPEFNMENVETLEIGSQAPDFTAVTLDGESVSIASYTQKAVAFIFISPTCTPCLEKIPLMNTLESQAKLAGVELVLVNTTDREKTKAFVEEFNIELPVLVAPRDSNSFVKDYKVGGTPFFCLIDRKGKVQATGFLGSDWYTLIHEWMATQPNSGSCFPVSEKE